MKIRGYLNLKLLVCIYEYLDYIDMRIWNFVLEYLRENEKVHTIVLA